MAREGLSARDIRRTVGEAVPVPDHLVLLVVLDEQTEGGHVVAVDDDAGVGRVARPAHAVAVVRPPGPDVVEDDVVAVDDQAVRRAARLPPAN